MKGIDDSVFSSNAVRLTWRGWLIVSGLFAAVVLASPWVWTQWETFEPAPSFRIPYDARTESREILGEDYWLFSRWAARAAARHPILIVGDSCMWGEYVDADDAFSQCLNRAVGKESFANLGVNGLHPAAARGLLRYYGKAVSGKSVIVHFNPLWVRSPVVDLTEQDEAERFKPLHTKLLDQFDRGIRNYGPSTEDRLSAVLERSVPALALKNHLRIVYYRNMASAKWALANPYECPVGALRDRDPVDELSRQSAGPHTKPIRWDKNPFISGNQDFPWVDLGKSYQWRCFKDELDTLKARGNKVFVLLGPFNPYIMTPESLAKYRILRDEMVAWLKTSQIAHHAVPDLPSEMYPDASHVVKEGYVEMARLLLADAAFQEWMDSAGR